MKRFTKEEDQLIIDSIKSKCTMKQLLEKLEGVSYIVLRNKIIKMHKEGLIDKMPERRHLELSEQDKVIVNLYNKGMTYKDIGDNIKRSKQYVFETVKNLIKKDLLVDRELRKQYSLTNEDKQVIKQMYEEGYYVNDIKNKLDITTQMACNYVNYLIDTNQVSTDNRLLRKFKHSKRMQKILDLLKQGYSAIEISCMLQASTHNVYDHINVLRKLKLIDFEIKPKKLERFSKEDDDFIINNYNKISYTDMSMKLKRPSGSIYQRIRNLKAKKLIK